MKKTGLPWYVLYYLVLCYRNELFNSKTQCFDRTYCNSKPLIGDLNSFRYNLSSGEFRLNFRNILNE